ncbi:hypothetical protein M413DRAFT_434962 [Hebeloma cylindrosporum]|uniref:Uncharacterized protein n=1 Tax=Hebeloma cylindrosporum TaxID=76867 RepID=A0A0C3BU12_HEBCY|nr:hypothetical protein M413DRAFT_434962 [Hebeloma cylindrosporum h7]
MSARKNLVSYDSVGEDSDEPQRDMDSDSDYDTSFIPRSRAKHQATSPRQTRSRTKSVTPSVESDHLPGNETEDVDADSRITADPDNHTLYSVTPSVESDHLPGNETEDVDADSRITADPDNHTLYVPHVQSRATTQEKSPRRTRSRSRALSYDAQCTPLKSKQRTANSGNDPGHDGLMYQATQYRDEDPTPRASQRTTRRGGNHSSRNSESGDKPLPAKPIYVEQQTTRTPASAEDITAVDVSTNSSTFLSGWTLCDQVLRPQRKNKLLVKLAQDQQAIISERDEDTERLSEALVGSKNRISNSRQKIKELEQQVYQLQTTLRKQRELTESSTKPDCDVNELKSRLEARDAEIERLRVILDENANVIEESKKMLEERMEMTDIWEVQTAMATGELESQSSEPGRLQDSLLAVESELDELRTLIEKERPHSALKRTSIRYRKERDEKRKEVAAVVANLESIRQELENVRQQREKDLESAQAREIELMLEVHRCRMARMGKGKAKESVDESDEEQELRNELENLKQKVAMMKDKESAITDIASRKSPESHPGPHDKETERQGSPTPGLEQGTSNTPPTTTNGSTRTTVLRGSGKSSSIAPSQAGSSTIAQPDADFHDAREKRDEELERRRRQADALLRRRRSAMPGMGTGDLPNPKVDSRKPSRSPETIGGGRIDKQDANDLDQPPRSSNASRWISQAIKAHLTRNSAKTTNCPRRFNPTKAIVEDDKKKDTPVIRNAFCAIVRTIFLHAFGLEKTDEYALVTAASRSRANAYNGLGQGDGPNLLVPEIDMDGKISSPWNVKLIKLFAQETMAVLQELPQLEEFPIRTQAYFEDMVRDHMERAQGLHGRRPNLRYRLPDRRKLSTKYGAD